MGKWITVVPAYGRDYKSAAKAKADWEAGKDFIIKNFNSPWDGKPANKKDLAGLMVQIRYYDMTRIVVVEGIK